MQYGHKHTTKIYAKNVNGKKKKTHRKDLAQKNMNARTNRTLVIIHG